VFLSEDSLSLTFGVRGNIPEIICSSEFHRASVKPIIFNFNRSNAQRTRRATGIAR
jgi:hypothetical protein